MFGPTLYRIAQTERAAKVREKLFVATLNIRGIMPIRPSP